MDFAEMGARLGLEKEEFMELIDIFITSAEEDLQRLTDSLRNNDTSGAAEAAHSLKGSSGNLGFATIAAMAAKIEQSARNGSLSDLEPISDSISLEMEKIKALI